TNHPDNLDEVSEMIGLPGWTLPGKNEADALNSEVDLLISDPNAQPMLIGVVDPAMARLIYNARLIDPNGLAMLKHDPETWQRIRQLMESYQLPPQEPPPGPAPSEAPQGSPPLPDDGGLGPQGPPPNTPG